MRKLFVGPVMIVVTMSVSTIVAGCGGSGSTKSDSAQTTVADQSRPPPAQYDDRTFCGLIQTYGVRMASISLPSTPPDEIRSFAKGVSPALQSAIASAPAELKADVTAIAAAAENYLVALEASGYDLAKMPPEAAEGFSAPDVAAATARLQAYSHDTCGTGS